MFSSSIENASHGRKRNADASKNLPLTGCFRKGRARETEALKYKNGQPATKHEWLVHQRTNSENTVQMRAIFDATQNFVWKDKNGCR
jgi:hypothetical protein